MVTGFEKRSGRRSLLRMMIAARADIAIAPFVAVVQIESYDTILVDCPGRQRNDDDDDHHRQVVGYAPTHNSFPILPIVACIRVLHLVDHNAAHETMPIPIECFGRIDPHGTGMNLQ